MVLRLALAAVFAVAGAAKLADRRGSREAMAGFGVPARLADVAGRVLPLVELAIAVALLPRGSAVAGAGGALGLLVVFAIVVGRSIARGEAPDCHCFGQLHSRPAGAATLARNAGLAMLAGIALAAGPGPSAVAWVGRLHGTSLSLAVCGVVVAALLALVAWLTVTMLRAHGRLLLRIDELERRLAIESYDKPWTGLPLGEPAPSFELPATDGRTYALADVLALAEPTLLVFTNPHCGPCQEVMPDVAGWTAVEVISSGPEDAIREEAARLGLDRVMLDPDRIAAESYAVHGTPAAVAIAPDGTISSDVAYGAEGVRELRERLATFALDVLTVQPVG